MTGKTTKKKKKKKRGKARQGFKANSILRKNIRKQPPPQKKASKRIQKAKDLSTRGSFTDIGEFTPRPWAAEKPLFRTTEELTDKTHHFPSDISQSQFDSRMSVRSEAGLGREELEGEAEPELEADPAPEEIVIEETRKF